VNKPLIDAIGLFLAIIPFSLAQTATSVIRGTIQDRTSAVLIRVHVTLRDETRNQVWEQTTNEEGIFEFRALPFGNYRVEVEHPHFKKEVIENIALQVAQTQNLKVTLQRCNPTVPHPPSGRDIDGLANARNERHRCDHRNSQ